MELIRSKPNRTYAGKAKEAENLKDFNPSDYPKYQELDFTGITDLKTGGTKLALYTQLNDATKVTPILGTHLVYDSLSLKDEFFTCEKNGTSYILKSPSFTITITNAGAVTCEKAKVAKEYVLCDVILHYRAINESEAEQSFVSSLRILREKSQTYNYTITELISELTYNPIIAYYDFGGSYEGPYIETGVLQYDSKSETFLVIYGGDNWNVTQNIDIFVIALA